MESTTQSKSYFPLGVFLSPVIVPFLAGFVLYSFRHRKGYKGTEEYQSRYFFFKKMHWVLSQLIYQTNVLKMNDHLTQKNTLMAIYSKKLTWELLALSFLLSDFYKENFQKVRLFKLCFLTKKRPWWLFILSSLEILEKIPSNKHFKELQYPIICFSDSLDSLKKIALKSYKTTIFFKFERLPSFTKGSQKIFQAVGIVNSKDRLKSIAQTELKIDKILSLLN